MLSHETFGFWRTSSVGPYKECRFSRSVASSASPDLGLYVSLTMISTGFVSRTAVVPTREAVSVDRRTPDALAWAIRCMGQSRCRSVSIRWWSIRTTSITSSLAIR
jgi:hypothetical protein